MSEVASEDTFVSHRLVLLTLVWGLFIAWMVIGYFDALAGSDSRGASAQILLLCLDLWGLFAGALLGLISFNPFHWLNGTFHWLNGKRLICGSVAFAVVLGRISGWCLPDALAHNAIPGLLLFLGTPFVLLFGGIGVILIPSWFSCCSISSSPFRSRCSTRSSLSSGSWRSTATNRGVSAATSCVRLLAAESAPARAAAGRGQGRALRHP